MKRFFVIIASVCCSFVANAQQGFDLHKFQQAGNAAADKIKKNNPQAAPKKEEGLPADYDNSWKISINVTRSMKASADLKRPGDHCYSDVESSLTALSGSLHCEQAIGYVSDGTQVTVESKLVENFPKYGKPLEGSLQLTHEASATTQDCSSGSAYNGSASSHIDASLIDFTFSYDNKLEQGNFTLGMSADYQSEKSGKMKTWAKDEPSHETDASQVTDANMRLQATVLGGIFATNYSSNAAMTAAQNTPLGGIANIVRSKDGYNIQFDKSVTVQNKTENETGPSSITYTTHVQITLSHHSEYDAILEAVNNTDYKKWIPEGPELVDPSAKVNSAKHPRDKGNTAYFRVYIAKKSDTTHTPIPGMKFTVEYQLNSSHEKGVCMNYPEDARANSDPDLIFDSALRKNSSFVESWAQDRLISKKDVGGSLSAIITSYDYGSYGSLKARVTIHNPNGSEDLPVYAHVKENNSDSLMIPYDKNQNHIADAWEEQMNILDKNLSASSDEDDKPADLNKDYKGDGLSVYEEYRGFSENYKYIRTDPLTRDIMVCNNIPADSGLYRSHAENGISLFQGVTHLKVHSNFKPPEFGKHLDQNPDAEVFTENGVDIFHYDKTVNFNYTDKDHHATDQHGILICLTRISDNSCSTVPKAKGEIMGPPKNWAFLCIGPDFDPNFSKTEKINGKPVTTSGFYSSRGTIQPNGTVKYDPNGKAEVLTDFYSVSVAHEMLHYVDVPHHGDNDMEGSYSVDDDNAIWFTGKRIFDESAVHKKVRFFLDGKELSADDPSFRYSIYTNSQNTFIVGVQHGETSGTDDCIMRYSVASLYEKGNEHYCLPAAKPFPNQLAKFIENAQITGTSLCTSDKATGINAPPYSYFGNAAAGRGNCKNKIRISDKD